ncbi:S8 family serine peptidase [bacterium 3DAC]|nr:S8 family serine peptidase [bacterium 3DAC]
MLKKFLVIIISLSMLFMGMSFVPPMVRAEQTTQAGPALKLRTGIPPKLSAASTYGTTGSRLYILQFTGPVKPEYKQAIKDLGIQIGDYIPDFAFVVKGTKAQMQKALQLSFVSNVYEYRAKYRISPEAMQAIKSGEYDKVVAYGPIGDLLQIQQILSSMGITDFDDMIEEMIEMVEQLYGEPVYWIDMKPQNVIFNDEAAKLIKVNPVAWTDYGYHGENQIVGIMDTGLDTGNASTLHPDLKDRLLKAYAYGRSNDWSDPNGHGTHVAGSVVGTGAASDGKIKGMAYGAKIVFQSVLDSNGGLGGLPDDLNDAFKVAYDDGARIHTNSWGCPYQYCQNKYDTQSSQVDEFMWNHPDMTILFAAGNDGDYDRDGQVEYNTVTPPSTAKNCITVGAAENYRPDKGSYADNPNDIALFSSRGWTSDGRIKPDVVAPGTWILSTRSSLAPDDHFWGNYNQYYAYMGGTSMATPITAGFTAIVRQWLQKAKNYDDPSSSLIKALLIATARPLGDAIVSADYGWGEVDMNNIMNGSLILLDEAQTKSLSTGDSWTYTFDVNDTSKPVKVVLVWRDYPGSPQASSYLVNDLDLTVTTPSGSSYYGNHMLYSSADRKNNVEVVYISSPQKGTYTIKVKGYNVPDGPQPFSVVVFSGGATSGGGSEETDNPPSVSFAKPENGAVVDKTFDVEINASDDKGVSKVELYVNSTDGDPIKTWTEAPYTITLDASNASEGDYKLIAVAYDTADQKSQAEITITVKHQQETDNPPSVSFAKPENGAVVDKTFDVEINASDDKGVSKVELYVNSTDGDPIKTWTEAPYTITLDASNASEGDYKLIAVAYDTADQKSQAEITITVKHGSSDTTAPSVSITSPKNGDTVSGKITVEVSASDDSSGVSKVELYVDGSKVSEDTSAPYTFSLDTTSLSDGTHKLLAKAYDAAGNVGTSEEITITVKNSSEEPPAAATATAERGYFGKFSSSGDTKYYYINITTQTEITIKAYMESTLDMDIYLMNSSGTVLAKSENGKGEAESITYTLSPGVYKIKAYNYSGYGYYIIYVDNKIDTAKQVFKTISGSVTDGGSKTYTLNLKGITDIYLDWGDSDVDLDLYVYDSSGNLVAKSEYGKYHWETLNLNLSAGTYTIVVKSYSGGSDFTLSVLTDK